MREMFTVVAVWVFGSAVLIGCGGGRNKADDAFDKALADHQRAIADYAKAIEDHQDAVKRFQRKQEAEVKPPAATENERIESPEVVHKQFLERQERQRKDKFDHVVTMIKYGLDNYADGKAKIEIETLVNRYPEVVDRVLDEYRKVGWHITNESPGVYVFSKEPE